MERVLFRKREDSEEYAPKQNGKEIIRGMANGGEAHKVQVRIPGVKAISVVHLRSGPHEVCKVEITVTCFFTADCLLPCNSTHHIIIIHWNKVGKENAVHIFDNNSDHLENQDVDFRGRTSLFRDQISQGNVSLLLRKVRVEDEGIYTCYTFSRSEQLEEIIHLDVKAAIKRVEIKLNDEQITCNASEVYPQPIISWFKNQEMISDDHMTNMTTLTTDTQGLFSLTSHYNYKKDERDRNTDQSLKRKTEYSCSFSFEDKSQTYNASLRHDKVNIYSGQDARICCPVAHGDAGDYIITLRFGESSTILKSHQTNISINWSGISVHLAHDGNVMLSDLDMNKHAGNYTCEMFTEQSITQVVRTSVHIISDLHNNGIAEVLGAAVPILSIITIIIYCGCRRSHGRNNRNQENSRENQVYEEVMLEPLSGENLSADACSSNGRAHREPAQRIIMEIMEPE
ncbi:butyrophilin subfamily 2 member A2-like isoform X1 [Silurus meridionalis]|nr:butyrophilin subfamily 2 member A2-like isoform X1 [Silurus meridionalis]